MPELRGYRPGDREFLAVVDYPQGRRFIAQPDGSLAVQQGTQRIVGVEETERLAQDSPFYRLVHEKLLSLYSFATELMERDPRTLREKFTLSSSGLSAQSPSAPSPGITFPLFLPNP